jgi:hypothetical protein
MLLNVFCPKVPIRARSEKRIADMVGLGVSQARSQHRVFDAIPSIRQPFPGLFYLQPLEITFL